MVLTKHKQIYSLPLLLFEPRDQDRNKHSEHVWTEAMKSSRPKYSQMFYFCKTSIKMQCCEKSAS